MKRCDMSDTNTIELFDKESDLIMTLKPFSFDLNSYKIEHGQPIKAMDSSL